MPVIYSVCIMEKGEEKDKGRVNGELDWVCDVRNDWRGYNEVWLGKSTILPTCAVCKRDGRCSAVVLPSRTTASLTCSTADTHSLNDLTCHCRLLHSHWQTGVCSYVCVHVL